MGSIRAKIVIGVTGPIACGKSTILRTLRELGADTIDADRVYHLLIEPGLPLHEQLVHHFGENILASDGEIDRPALAKIVFSDSRLLQQLDRLTHPAISAEIRSMIAKSDANVVAIDAVKLVESGTYRICDEVWLVTCQLEQQVTRLMERNGLNYAEALRRIESHQAVSADHPAITHVIDNSGTVADTQVEVTNQWQRIVQSA